MTLLELAAANSQRLRQLLDNGATPDGRYPNALFFDFGAVPEPERGLAARLRDYVVRVVPGSEDRLLGPAFLAAGRVRVPAGWFSFERANSIGA